MFYTIALYAYGAELLRSRLTTPLGGLNLTSFTESLLILSKGDARGLSVMASSGRGRMIKVITPTVVDIHLTENTMRIYGRPLAITAYPTRMVIYDCF